MGEETPDIKLLKGSIPGCRFGWNQGVTNNSKRIIEQLEISANQDGTGLDTKIKDFFGDCERTIKDVDKCKFAWNLEVFKFGGDVNSYVVFFVSDILKLPIKVAFSWDMFESTVAIARMDIAGYGDKQRLDKALRASDSIKQIDAEAVTVKSKSVVQTESEGGEENA